MDKVSKQWKPVATVLVGGAIFMAMPYVAQARWEEQADDLPAWAQRGRMIFLRWDDREMLPEFKDWQPVIHLHGARHPGSLVATRQQLRIPASLRLEAAMFFGDDRALAKVKAKTGGSGYVEHTWYWQYGWWQRDPAFRQAALIKRDGQQMVEYLGNPVTEREAGNPLSPLLHRMRSEVSQSVLTPRLDPSSTVNPLYPNFPYQPYDDVRFGAKEPYEFYPVFGHLSMLWYDNPVLWADSSPYSQKIWEKHFKEKFGVEIMDPASHPSELVRREWVRFWADAYGDYWEDYYKYHQANVQKSAVPETTTGLNGQRHLTVGMNSSLASTPWGAQLLYLFNHRKISDFPGLLVEYTTQFTRGKFAPIMRFSMAAMHGRQTGGSHEGQRMEAEALALNGTDALAHLTPRTQAYVQFQYDNRALLTNALQGNRIGIVYNTRSGLVTNTLINGYELGQQLDELGIPYDVIVEEDLEQKNSAWLQGYKALLVPGGEFDEHELTGLQQYVKGGGHLVLIGDVEMEGPQYAQLTSTQALEPWRRDESLTHNNFMDMEIANSKIGKGTITVRDDQILSNLQLEQTLKPQLNATYRVLDSKGGTITCNVLNQPRQGDARILGLVNYSGETRANVRIVLPRDMGVPAAAVISPDGYAQGLEVKNVNGTPTLTVPELYNYTMVLIGKPEVVAAALATVQPKIAELVKIREPLAKLAEGANTAMRPEEVPQGMRLSHLRHGSGDSGAYIALDATAPRKAKIGETVRVQMHILDTGSHYPATAALEYWRIHAINVQTGAEVRTQPLGAAAPIDGAGVQLLDGQGEAAVMPYVATELNGKTLVADLKIDTPGSYQIYVDYYYHNKFLQGDAGPRVEPAFAGDRPAAGLKYPNGLGKLYIRYKLPRMVINVGNG